jgi:hypothetical protein
MDNFLKAREPKKFDPVYSDQIRKKYLSNTLNANQKMQLYTCAVEGNLENLKKLIEIEKYSLLEECSATGYYWTVFHYAAHYGIESIITYVMEYYQNDCNKKNISNLQSNLGLSPLFICLNSSVSIDKKKNILELYVKYDAIDFNICNKNGEDIYDICKKQGLLEYFFSILKED